MYRLLLRGRDVVLFFAIDRLISEVIAVCCSAKADFQPLVEIWQLRIGYLPLNLEKPRTAAFTFG